jgi:hypothetical protein
MLTIPKAMNAATSVLLALAPLAVAAAQTPANPPPTPPPTPATATTMVRPPIPAAPVLPRDARDLVDQSTRSLIEQLQALQESYLARQRPDDAAAVRTQIQLLRQVTGLADDPSRNVDHVRMTDYRDRIGDTFEFTITGSADEPVWGTGTYTDDTPLESAAVHAGALRSGQTGRVRVTVLAGQKEYVASKQHGLQSSSAGPAGGSYRLESGSGTSSRPGSLESLRGRAGETLTLPVVGATTGAVWGSDIYTDDSSIAAAAVHAGILQPGEFGFVRVTLVGGQAQYSGVARNGVTSQEYGEWEGGFQLAAASPPFAVDVPDDVTDASGFVRLSAFRKGVGTSFSMPVVGAAGSVRGSGIYTDDSSIAAAAVHAGLLKVGEKGYVKITILAGQQSYTGSLQNGIKSADAGVWNGSFQIDRGTGRPRRH